MRHGPTTYDIAELVSRLKPGEEIAIDRELIPPYYLEMLGWSPVDGVLENIVGSAYDITIFHDVPAGKVFFRRLKEPLKDGRHTYVSPDRRWRYRKDDTTGYFVPIC